MNVNRLLTGGERVFGLVEPKTLQTRGFVIRAKPCQTLPNSTPKRTRGGLERRAVAMNENRVLLRNVAECRLCGDVIESKSRHDFVSCKCGGIFTDGGLDYVRRGATDPANIIDRSERAAVAPEVAA